MEKENQNENREEYMDKIKERHDRMVFLQKKGQKLCMSEDSLKAWKEKTEQCLADIENFQKTLNGDFFGGHGPAIRVQTYNPQRGGDWKTLYQYQMNNVDDLMELITDRLYDRLEKAINQTNRITEEINNMHEDKWN